MIIASPVITHVIVPPPVVTTAIAIVVMGLPKVEVVVIGVCNVDAERPLTPTRINRTTEVIGAKEASVLCRCQYPAQVIVTIVKRSVIPIHSPLLSPDHIVHQIADGIDKVVIDLIGIVILSGIQVEFMRHLIGKEAGFFPNPASTHSGHAHAAHGNGSDGKQKDDYSFHIMGHLNVRSQK